MTTVHIRVSALKVTCLMLVGLCGCGTRAPDCPSSDFEYGLGAALVHSDTQGAGLNVSGYSDAECRVQFISLTATAEYLVIPWFAKGDAALAPRARLRDSAVCKGFSVEDSGHWTVVAGPPFTRAQRSDDCLEITFGSAMRDYLGSTTYDVRATCGKDVLLQASGIDAKRCPL